MRGQALPCTEGATGLSRRIFSQKKKTLWGTLGNSPAATAPVSSPPCHPSGDCAHLISEGAETTGTTRGRVPSNQEGAQLPGSARISFQRELRLQAPPGGGCPVSGSVPRYRAVCPVTRECLHLISEGTETTGTRESVNQGRLCMHTHRPEKAYHKKRVGRSWEHQDTSWKRKPTNKGNTNR